MRLAHTMIRVKNLEETYAFYCGFLGLKKVREHEVPGDCVLAFLTDEAGSYHIELTYNCDDREYTLGDQFGHLAFHVDDLEPVIAEVEKRGWWYRGSRPEMKSKYIFVKDPNGYEIEILESKKS
jgi:lactoylglutathione lyase